MYESIPGYLKGFIDGGFFWYTLAGLLLFFIFDSLKNNLGERSRWTLVHLLFGGYIFSLAGVMLSPWRASGGLIYPTEWFSLSEWQSGSFLPSPFPTGNSSCFLPRHGMSFLQESWSAH
ncbi:MAG: hypothetical protein IIY89_08575 [Clostridia bacterium]|nr:hypothetical protein [Clostridia bacterium]